MTGLSLVAPREADDEAGAAPEAELDEEAERGADDELEDDFCFFVEGGLAGEPPPPLPEPPLELEDDAAAAAGACRASDATMPGYALDNA